MQNQSRLDAEKRTVLLAGKFRADRVLAMLLRVFRAAPLNLESHLKSGPFLIRPASDTVPILQV